MNSAIMGPLETVLSVLAPPHRAGYPFIAGAVAAAVLGFFTYDWLVWAGVLLALGCWFFFRDPVRVPSPIAGTVLAAADGRITSIEMAVPPPELGLGSEPLLRIATFLSVLNVHVNRMPYTGTVTKVAYNPGIFLSAADDKASDANERNSVLLRLDDGRDIGIVQIAGLIARRILCDVREGDRVTVGERFGIIRFGSRTDIYLPPGVSAAVAVGQTAIGGETVMAYLAD
jgi:phosphatidylserine decarboxylase